MFTSEREMSLSFEKFLKINFGNSYLKEYAGLFGIPDFLFYSNNKQKTSIVSFELKLKNWKKATKQAFKYKSFSDVSYVVLSGESVNIALNNIDIFEKYNIGLAKFDANKKFEILYKPEITFPYSEILNQKIIDVVRNSRKKAKNIDCLTK